MLKSDRRKSRCKTVSVWAALPCIVLVAGCTPGEGEFNISDYLSRFAAPAPINASALATFFAGALQPSVVTQTAALFTSNARYMAQTTNGWSITLNTGQNLTGLVSNPLKSSGAAFAHVAGVTGSGAVIAVSDDQFLTGYAEFAGPNSTTTVQVLNNWENLFPENGAASPHGTITTAVAVGDSSDFVGVAPDATVLFGSYETNQKLAALGVYAKTLGAVAWNNSWGYTTLGLNQTDFNIAFGTFSANTSYLAALDGYAAQGVVVFAASNNNTNTHSGLLDGLPFLRPSLEAGWIAAVNGVPTFSGGTVSSVQLLSSSCLEAARWCLIADGAWKVPDASLQLQSGEPLVTGSSFAAPQISGALALLQQAFPTLSPHELRVRLLASAEDTFFSPDAQVELATGFSKGYSITYGHGFLDIEAALKPIGGTAMSLASGAVVSTNAAVLQTGMAFGDAVEVSLAGTDVLVKDALSGGFVMPATALATGARPASRAAGLLSRSLTGDLAHDRTTDVAALSDPFASFGGSTMDMTTSDGAISASVLMPQSGAQGVGINLTRALTEGPTRVELGLKLAMDDGSLMSLDGKDEAMMASVSLGIAQDLGATGFIALSGEIGMTDLGGATSIGGSGSAQFNSAAVKIGSSDVFAKGDRLTLGVAMPMAVASGQRVLDLPVYRQTAAAAFEPVALALAPQNRQLDFEIGYQAALSDGLEMKLSLIHSNNFGNREGEVDSGAALAFTLSF